MASSSSNADSKEEEEDAELKGGEVVFAGNAAWSMVGKSNKTSDFDGVESQILWGFHRLQPLVGVKVSKVVAGPNSCTCVALAADGRCFTWGRNNHGQLGQGHQTNVYNPMVVDVPGDESIVAAGCGPGHTLLVSAAGHAFAAGTGKSGQLGVGRKTDMVKSFVAVAEVGKPVTRAACGRDFSMLVDAEGGIYSFGHPEFGCLGNGTDGKTLARANKFEFDCVTSPQPIDHMQRAYPDAKITEVACGANHTLAMDSQGRVYTWGFGGFGRLGHKDNKDQFRPLAVELFSHTPPPPDESVPAFLRRTQPPVRGEQITCGSTSSFVVTGEPYNCLYMFGITKRTGEAVMYPTVEEQVHGWRVRSVSVGATSTAVAADRSLITWGASPTFGELGYGADGKKSSTKSAAVETLAGAICMQLASGSACTLAVVDIDDDKSKAVLEKVPVFFPDEVDPKLAKAAEAKAADKKRAMRAKKAAKKNAAGSATANSEATAEAGADAAGADAAAAEDNDSAEPSSKKAKTADA